MAKHNLTYNVAACTWWPWIGLQNLVTSLHLIYTAGRCSWCGISIGN